MWNYSKTIDKFAGFQGLVSYNCLPLESLLKNVSEMFQENISRIRLKKQKNSQKSSLQFKTCIITYKAR